MSDIELATRRLLAMVNTRMQRHAEVAADSASASLSTDVQAAIDAHAALYQNVHGVGTSFYVAKTSDPTRFPTWTDITNKPASVANGIDDTAIQIAASQVVSGMFVLARIPVANLGVVSSTKVVRADDPRLSTSVLVAPTSDALQAGDYISFQNDGSGNLEVIHASAASTDYPALGYVVESAGIGDSVSVYTIGANPLVSISGLSSADIRKPVFLSTTPGKASKTPPSGSGQLLQTIGHIMSISSPGVANVLAAFETIFYL